MKFLCIDCDEQMTYEDRQEPGDGTFTASYVCPGCGRRMAMLANPMETQLVGSLGVKVGGRTLDQQPMELVRQTLEGRDDAFVDDPSGRPCTTLDLDHPAGRFPHRCDLHTDKTCTPRGTMARRASQSRVSTCIKEVWKS